MLCTSSLVVQFSMTNVRPFLRALDYYITIFAICQALFSIFLKFFQSSFQRLMCDTVARQATCIFYHFGSDLSRVFFNFFRHFSTFYLLEQNNSLGGRFLCNFAISKPPPYPDGGFLIYLMPYISSHAHGYAPCCTYTGSVLLRRFQRMPTPCSWRQPSNR